MHFDRVIYSRETYDTLKFFGDLGGLNEALTFIGSLLVSWLAKFNAGSFLVSMLYSQSTTKF